ncbi:hypothetical protein D3H55_16735 [Bacillus salacetis]|uniref:Uncharacterized protein n=1 Tax=Bacillus salacetis TaxID=2315464 RepID=A0A3A1QSL7_9BACI|nr:hypothetical protein [Bacillus salacetis]RIW30384.1 hypothetical protein D3H55_16735 [Bacillus salacetis]
MDKTTAMEIIKNESLENYCFFCEDINKEEAVVITENDIEWIVFTNDERGTKISEKVYKEESKALMDFIERLRGGRALRQYINGKRGVD